eukprot:404028_1
MASRITTRTSMMKLMAKRTPWPHFDNSPSSFQINTTRRMFGYHRAKSPWINNYIYRDRMQSHKRRFSSHPKYRRKFHLFLVPVLVIGAGIYTIASGVVNENMMDCKSLDTSENPNEEEEDDDMQGLRVRVLRGDVLSDDYDIFSSIDPYVEIEYDGRKRKTKAVKNSSTPIWDQSINFKKADKGKRMVIKVYDYDHLTPDDFVGSATLTDLPTQYNQNKQFEVDIKDVKGKVTAKIYLDLEFTAE